MHKDYIKDQIELDKFLHSNHKFKMLVECKTDREKMNRGKLRKFVGSGLNCVNNENRTYASVLKSDAREYNMQQRT